MKLFKLLFVLLIVVSCKKRDPDPEILSFSQFFKYNFLEETVSAVATSDGGYVIAATIDEGVRQSIFVAKVDQTGKNLWNDGGKGIRYRLGKNCEAHKVIEDAQGQLVIVGGVQEKVGTKERACMLVLRENGELVNQRLLTEPDSVRIAYLISPSNQANEYKVLIYNMEHMGGKEPLLMDVDMTNSNNAKPIYFDANSYSDGENFAAMIAAEDERLLMFTNLKGGQQGQSEIQVFEVNDPYTVWTTGSDDSNYTVCNDAKGLINSKFIIVGSVNASGHPKDIYLARINSGLYKEKISEWTAKGNQEAFSVARAGSRYVVTGYTDSSGTSDIFVALADEELNMIRNTQRTWGGSERDCGRVVMPAADGGFVIVAVKNNGSELEVVKIQIPV